MKKLILLLMLMPLVLVASAQTNPLQAKVDERVELASVFCHLVGFNAENNLNECGTYLDAVEEYFAPYLRDVFIIANPDSKPIPRSPMNYQAIVSASLALKIENEEVKYDSVNTDYITMLEINSQREGLDKIVVMLSRFYKLTSFDKFFKSQRSTYIAAEKLYNEYVITEYKTDIYEDLFGTDHQSIKPYLSMLSGSLAYSVPQASSLILGVVGCPDEIKGGYIFNSTPIDNLLSCVTDIFVYNELSSIEPMVKIYTESYYKSAVVMFDRSGYSIDEIFLNQYSKLCQVYYTSKDINSQAAFQKLVKYKSEGFIWINELWDSFDQLIQDRALFPYFKDMVPALVEKYKQLPTY
ncbi:MAG: DUF4932 domain-containing protein [bacterium]